MIETTGLADPAPVIQSFILEETLRSNTELDAVVTVVDARHIYQQLDNEQAREQIAFADIIILNKIDLVSEHGLDDVVRRLRSLNPLAPDLHRHSMRCRPAECPECRRFRFAQRAEAGTATARRCYARARCGYRVRVHS